MASMTSEWDEFAKAIKQHIIESGKKYKFNDNLELANMLPWEWALGDATKYMFEVLRWVNTGVVQQFTHPREVMMENLLKAAHCIQIAHTKLMQAQPKPEPEPEKPDEKKEWA